jgi:hypothetical protein
VILIQVTQLSSRRISLNKTVSLQMAPADVEQEELREEEEV